MIEMDYFSNISDIEQRARTVCEYAHDGQYRKAPDENIPYYSHPFEVVKTIKLFEGRWNLRFVEKETYAIGYLHDVIEDTSFTKEDLLQIFPTEECGNLVDSVVKLTKGKIKQRDLNIMLYNARMKTFNYEEILVKLADIYCNTLDISKSVDANWMARFWTEKTAMLQLLYTSIKNYDEKGIEGCFENVQQVLDILERKIKDLVNAF